MHIQDSRCTLFMVLPIKISTNEASKSQFREAQPPTGHHGNADIFSFFRLHF